MDVNHDWVRGTLWLNIIILSISFVSTKDATPTVVPIISYPIEGEKVVFTCTMKDLKNQTTFDVEFRDDYDVPYVNESGINILIFKDEASFTTVATLTFNSVQLTDITKERSISRCKASDPTSSFSSASVFQIYVIPKVSVPKVSVVSEPKLLIKKGGEVSLACNASIAGLGENVQTWNITWFFKNIDKPVNLSDNAQLVYNNTSATERSSQLILRNASAEIAGVYYCSAILVFEAVPGYDSMETPATMYNASIEIEKVIDVKKLEDSKQEVESKKGDKEVTFDCEVENFPPPNIIWKKNDDIINANSNSRYIFSRKSEDDAARRYLTIKNLQSSDRGVYKCIVVERDDGTFTKIFTLRVRDPMGALWPFIGIVVEAIVLVFIIGGYELWKKKQKRNHFDTKIKSPSEIEKSPLIMDPVEVVYSGGEDGVRLRTANNTA